MWRKSMGRTKLKFVIRNSRIVRLLYERWQLHRILVRKLYYCRKRFNVFQNKQNNNIYHWYTCPTTILYWYSISEGHDTFHACLDYVEDVYQTILCAIQGKTLDEAQNELQQMTPLPMHSMLEKQSRDEAITKQSDRWSMKSVDIPPTNPG